MGMVGAAGSGLGWGDEGRGLRQGGGRACCRRGALDQTGLLGKRERVRVGGRKEEMRENKWPHCFVVCRECSEM